MRLPDLDRELFGNAVGRVTIGKDLVITWDYVDREPRRAVEFVAREGDGTKLAILAVVCVEPGQDSVPGALIAEALHATAAMARRAYPDLLAT